MKTLLLLRHAKSSWDDPERPDIDRPLSERGKRNASHMGALIAERGWIPDRALISPATRTRQTWTLLSSGWDGDPRTVYSDDLYMASSTRLLVAIRKVPPTAGCVLILGHNPGLEGLALKLAGAGSDAAAFSRMQSKFPTAALARFQFSGAWADVDFESAALLDFIRPKDLD